MRVGPVLHEMTGWPMAAGLFRLPMQIKQTFLDPVYRAQTPKQRDSKYPKNRA